MREVFYEETTIVNNPSKCSRKYKLFKTLSILSYVLAGLNIFLGLFYPIIEEALILSLVMAFIPAVFFIILGILLGKRKNLVYVEYDYTFVTGSIRISKVIANLKRKSLFIFEAKEIEQIGMYGSDAYLRYEKTPGIVKKILTSNEIPNENKDFYYIVAVIDSEKHLLVIESTKVFVSNILKFTNRTILEKEFPKD